MSQYEKQLESYAVASKSFLRSQNRRIQHRTWYLYAAAPGAALALATSASADIIFSGVRNITVSVPPLASTVAPPQFAQTYIDIGGARFGIAAGNSNFTCQGSSTCAGATGLRGVAAFALLGGSSGRLGGHGEFVYPSHFFAKNFAASSVISSHNPFTAGTGILFAKEVFRTASIPFGQFPNGKVGFAGIRFTTGPGNPHLGWIRLSVSIPGSNAVSVTAIDWAYNDVVGAPVHVPVPEPSGLDSMIPMMLLALGWAGVLAWRKRRKEIVGWNGP